MLFPVKPLTALPDREGFLFRHGPYQVALFRVGDEVHAIDNECPHAGADLASGYTDGYAVACPWHCWEFDTRTGECRTVADYDVETYKVVIEEGIVKLELPE
ncbi:3-phenylpropionate/cinnamic acid dioxygenase ferredoxin subunit [Abditibacteriota bacterium]|nr:3-phenylpropionate/cinnamic acid dioxygenase ferredoxin subunit [Abditibacteriota bacterium]